KSEASEDTQEEVEDGKELPHTASRIDDGERVEAHFLDGVFNRFNVLGTAHAHAHSGVSGGIAGGLCGIANTARLQYVETLGQLYGQEYTGARISPQAVGIEFGDAHNLQLLFMRND